MHSVERGQGVHYEARGSDMWFKATSADTQGRFSFMERVLPPGGRMPPAHRHVGNDEAYFVLDGAVEFHVGYDLCTGKSGTFLLVPAGESLCWPSSIRNAPTTFLKRNVRFDPV